MLVLERYLPCSAPGLGRRPILLSRVLLFYLFIYYLLLSISTPAALALGWPAGALSRTQPASGCDSGTAAAVPLLIALFFAAVSPRFAGVSAAPASSGGPRFPYPSAPPFPASLGLLATPSYPRLAGPK